MPDRDDDDRERRSWSEIDKMRDRGGSGRSRHRSEREDTQSQLLRSESRKQQYLRQVNAALFGGKKESPAQDTARKALLDAAGKRTFTAVATKYWAEFGPTDDWTVLVALMDVTDPDLLESVAGHLAELFAGRSPAEQKMAVSKLRIVKMTAKDPDLIEIAAECLERIEV